MPHVIMFDFDGVIADSFDVFYEKYEEAIVHLGYERLASKEALLKLFEGNFVAQLLKQGFPVWKLKKFSAFFAPQIKEANARIEAFPHMPELVNQLAATHPLYIITSNTTAAVEAALVRYQIEGVREVLGTDKESSKVKKIRQVMKRYQGHTPWYIGDTKGDMVEANTAGAAAVAVTWGWHPEDTLREGEPQHVVHSHEQLRELLLAPA